MTLLKRSAASPATAAGSSTPEVLTVRPLRATFGPSVSVVSVDNHGHLWLRFSTAISLFVSGIILMAIPIVALWWVSGGLIDSGAVDFDTTFRPGVTITEAPAPANPTELPLAHNENSKGERGNN